MRCVLALLVQITRADYLAGLCFHYLPALILFLLPFGLNKLCSNNEKKKMRHGFDRAAALTGFGPREPPTQEPIAVSQLLPRGSCVRPKGRMENADVSGDMQQDSVACTTLALEKYNIEKDVAAHIKKEFDRKYNPTWHCIAGRNFGSYVTHETKHFIYFYLGQVAILLFKSV
ncbi:hypothetical protein MC885_020801 [Smutsia gigantea]|nr:hypothetical protein MC885_020801 [Smutsia gigantea]